MALAHDLCKLIRWDSEYHLSNGKFFVSSAEERNKRMKPGSAQFNLGVQSRQQEIVRWLRQLVGLLVFAVAVVFVAGAALAFDRQLATPQASQSTSIPNVKCVIGLENIKPNTKGTLSLLPAGLEFAAGKSKVNISTASIQDILTGQESRQDVSGAAGTAAKAGIPYGGGRVVSLFSHKVEVLTVEYVDSNGGFHGTIFVLSPGKASVLKDKLVAQGAKITTHAEAPKPVAQPSPPPEPGPAPQQAKKLTASAIQLERTEPADELLIPEDTRISTYENVIHQLTKTKKFEHVYRSGDRAAATAPDLVILRLIPEAFKAGSQKQREVTTVTGATSMKVKIQFTSRDDKILLEKDVEGKVRFYGENLRATYDLAKKVGALVHETF